MIKIEDGEILVDRSASCTTITITKKEEGYSYLHQVKNGVKIVTNSHLLEMSDAEKLEAINTIFNQQKQKEAKVQEDEVGSYHDLIHL